MQMKKETHLFDTCTLECLNGRANTTQKTTTTTNEKKKKSNKVHISIEQTERNGMN